MLAVAEKIETERKIHAIETSELHKKNFGQYFTPYAIAEFMASLFPVSNNDLNILDPGTGIGILSCALLNRIKKENWNNPSIKLSAYDIDTEVLENLTQNLIEQKKNFTAFDFKIHNADFLEKTSFEYSFGKNEEFTHVIMNPPYKKILSKSSARKFCRCFGLETVNLYSAFMGAAIAQLKEKGYLVAIIPRSFCNGLYYKPFREFILKNCSIKQIHLFESRKDAFKDESVLQENIIILLQKGTSQRDVKISYSNGADFESLIEKYYDFREIVNPFDKEKYINIPLSSCLLSDDFFNCQFVSLKETGISVSTGAVVDFRAKSFIRKNPDENTVPLLYPVHFKNYRTNWPKESKKPNAILLTEETKTMLVPTGNYVTVKRFSTKEEKKRIVASLVSDGDINASNFAFENHLNVFHSDKKGIQKELAFGLIVWLNSTFLDNQFRKFSGHTQVNATDLRNLPFPSKEKLIELGKKLEKYDGWNQELFDSIARECLNEKSAAANF